LYEQKALTLTYEHLSEVQKEAIRSFWKTFEHRLSTQQQDFLQLWKILPQIYKNFTSQLLEKGIGYAGLCYRQLYNNLSKRLLTNYKQLAIVGFNALHPAEEKIFAWLYSNIPTQFYWDTDAYYMDDKNQEAGYYLRSHQAKPYFQASFKKPFPTRI
ncbi:PD-(D/E)XK nuclease family protein, partial [Rhizobium leguminosarum]|nr:PD-(D/E)XK nuclease family protein [Rhizobium leguminosarum]